MLTSYCIGLPGIQNNTESVCQAGEFACNHTIH